MRGFDTSPIYTSSWQWGATRWFHGGSLTYYGKVHSIPVKYKRYRGFLSTTVELPATETFAVLLHLVMGSPMADYPELDENNLEFTLGVRYFAEHYSIDLGLIENLIWLDNSPDFGIHLGINRKY